MSKKIRKRRRNRCMSVLLTAVMTVGMLLAGDVEAAAAEETDAAEKTEAGWQTCTVYNGTNTEAQDYSVHASTIKSYLTPCEDGKWMRVQDGALEEGTLVEYYDEAYHLVSTKTIPKELPVFGGFYAAEQGYFLLTGQTNPEESAEVEVYRITKYDKDWNRIGSVGLKDCNTTVPFRAGTARMDVSGKYLLIRTSHEMYQSSDGLNHQANVTVQVDMETMEITDSYTIIMNSGYGYISHSFNQFIKVEDQHIAAVDHGDAYPRSIALTKYATDVSGGTFTPGFDNPCKVIDVLALPGATGQNATGASVGGFELSDTDYLIAGNSVIQDENNLTRRTRNVFVASVDKSTDEVKMHWLTDYEEGDGTTSTPQMVNAGNGKFLVLWTRNDTVYYTLINGTGERVGEIFEMQGNLSDCVPAVVNGKAVWYTWKNGRIAFYEIALDDLSKNQMKVFENGHKNEAQGDVVDGMITFQCTKCGLTKQVKVVTDMDVYWNEDGGNGYYWSRVDDIRKKGEKLYYWINHILPEDVENKEMEVIVDNPEIIQWTATSDTMGYFTMLGQGQTTITFRPKYNPAVEQTVSYTVEEAVLTPSDFIFIPPQNLTYDGAVKQAQINVLDGITGVGQITLKYYDSNQNLLDGAPKEPGIYTVRIDVAAGTLFEAVQDLTDSSWAFTIQPKSDSSETPNQPGDTGNTGNPNQPGDTGNTNQPGGSGSSGNQEQPKVGTEFFDSASKAFYRVTRLGEAGAEADYIKPDGNASVVKIPDTVKGNGFIYKVTGIAGNAFKNNKKVTKVTIGKNVSVIGKDAFSGCAKLKTVTIGKNVTEIKDRAFYKCTSLGKVVIPAKILKIGKKAFYGDKKLKTLTIKSLKLTGKTVGSQAFKGINTSAKIKVPAKKIADYKKLLKKKGINGKKQVIRK